jgi:outer membrane receptor for ferrienterochelin and colicin
MEALAIKIHQNKKDLKEAKQARKKATQNLNIARRKHIEATIRVQDLERKRLKFQNNLRLMRQHMKDQRNKAKREKQLLK